MTGSDDHPPKPLPTRTPAAEAARLEREKRLGIALRDNLRKRKAQRRAREPGEREPEDNAP